MEFRHLTAFITIAEELHFGRAAARLHLTQPSLSAQLQKLEKSLG
ncbi:MAG: DNA-binding transcriptional LysR family regulator, partial [Rhodococcus sp. (in: high G+C Gram-positive bacteria)]